MFPPGWCPGLPDYPLRLYFERLKLWYQIYDGEDTMVGPLVAGRLQGKAQRLGLTLRLPRPDGGVDIGGEALARLTVEEVRDPSDPTIILQQHVPSGVQALCNALKTHLASRIRNSCPDPLRSSSSTEGKDKLPGVCDRVGLQA